MKKKYDIYKLKVNIPGLEKGALFYHDTDDSIRGSIAHGCLKLAWINGNCQQDWCGDTFVFPGHLVKDDDCFEKINKKYNKEVSDREPKIIEACYKGLVVRTIIQEDD